jgi:hypothetical protein
MCSAEAAPVAVAAEALEALDQLLVHALETGDLSQLSLLGYGEISCVLAVDATRAAKPLPPFRDASAVDRYRRTFHAYLEGLAQRGIPPLPSELHVVERPGGQPVVWCVQPRLSGDALLPNVLRRRPEAEGGALFEELLDRLHGAVDGAFGVDGQLSNWALMDGELRYLDVTTPMMRDADGTEVLDTSLFLASLPALLRPAVRRFALRSILDKYYDPRGVVLDVLGNLLKERLDLLLPPFLEQANRRTAAPITVTEVRRYYAADARLWSLMQRLRRMDRHWQTRVRRRPYPFLLPGPIER